MRTETFKTKNIDLASFIIAVSGEDCTVNFCGPLADFEFPSNYVTRDALAGFETGMMVEGCKLLSIRNQLFRRIRGAK